MILPKAFCRDKSPVDKVRALIEEEDGFDPAVWQEIVELGWLGIGVPENYGGIGLGMAELVPLVEHMGRSLMNTPFVPTVLAAQAVCAGGSEAQKKNFAANWQAGRQPVWHLCEDHADWNLKISHCQPTRRPAMTLRGKKYLVLHAAAAQFVLASVALDGQAALLLIDGRCAGRSHQPRKNH